MIPMPGIGAINGNTTVEEDALTSQHAACTDARMSMFTLMYATTHLDPDTREWEWENFAPLSIADLFFTNVLTLLVFFIKIEYQITTHRPSQSIK